MKLSYKRIAAALFTALLFVQPLTGTAFAANLSRFSDVSQDHWAHAYIEDVVGQGLFSGTSASQFSPEAGMTRGMFVTVLSRMASVQTDNNVPISFIDVPTGMWYTGAIAWASGKGIVSGTTSTTFSPDSLVTREQLAVLMERFCSSMGSPLPKSGSPVTFTDSSSIGDYALGSIQSCYAAGLLSGYTDGSFQPLKPASRAEAAAICARLQRMIGTGKETSEPVEEPEPNEEREDDEEKESSGVRPGGNVRPSGGGNGGSSVRPAVLDLKLTQYHPDLVAVDNRNNAITAVSGASVEDLKAQVEPAATAQAYTFTVTDWLGEEKVSGNHRDLLTTGDQLVVRTDGQTRTFRVDVPNKEADEHYWDTDTYQEILDRVAENLPTFNDRIYDITDEKYAEDLEEVEVNGEWADDYTKVFRKAIAECSRNGGGTVLVPASDTVYRTGAIQLDDNVNLHLEEGAVIDFLPNAALEYYPRSLVSYEGIDYYGYSALIYAYQKTNIAVTGGGTLRASDVSQWAEDKEVLQRWNYSNTPVEDRDITVTDNKVRPVLVQLYDCKNVRISEVTLGNAPFWTMNLVLCENVLVRGIETTSISSNSDGCDPESCRYVVIENCRFANKDDNIALKSGRANNGKLRDQSTEYVIIRGNEFYQGSGISIGSESAGGVNDVFVENNFYNGRVGDDKLTGELRSRDAFRIKYANSMDAIFENIYFRNCAMGGFGDNLFLNEYVTNDYMLSVTGKGTDSLSYVPVIRNIAMSNLFSVPNRYGDMDSLFRLHLIETETQDLRPVDGLYFKDINLVSSNCNPYNKDVLQFNNAVNVHMENVTLNGVPLEAETRPITITDVKINDTLLNKKGTTDIESDGTDGVLRISGIIETEIENFEDIGSVRVSYDTDTQYAEADLARENGTITFTATLEGVTADDHDLAVVAKSDRLPFASPDEKAERASNRAPGIASNSYHIDVEGELRAMDLEIDFNPAAPETHISPMLHVGDTLTVTISAKDAKTGEPVTGFTVEAADQTNKGYISIDVSEMNTVVITAEATNKNSNTNNQVNLTVSKEGYAPAKHAIYKLVIMPSENPASLFEEVPEDELPEPDEENAGPDLPGDIEEAPGEDTEKGPDEAPDETDADDIEGSADGGAADTPNDDGANDDSDNKENDNKDPASESSDQTEAANKHSEDEAADADTEKGISE